jgi:hypothetical protein
MVSISCFVPKLLSRMPNFTFHALERHSSLHGHLSRTNAWEEQCHSRQSQYCTWCIVQGHLVLWAVCRYRAFLVERLVFAGWAALLGLSAVGAVLASVAILLGRRLRALLTMLVTTFQWLIENCTSVCGHEGLLFLLVTLALVSLNAPSLAYIAAAGYGMFCRQASLTALPRVLAPLSIVALLAQYALLVRISHSSTQRPSTQTLQLHTWLGLEPTPTTISLLLAIVCISVSLVHSSAWHAFADAPPSAAVTGCTEQWRRRCNSLLSEVDVPLQLPHAHERQRPAAHALYYIIRSLPAEPAKAYILLDPSNPRIILSSSTSSPASSSTPRLSCSLHWQSDTAFIHRRSAWRWPDHLRFWLFRFSLDALMVLMVALCCLHRDLIHAAYLGLTLFLFRRREELRLRGNGLFFWMPLANYSFIVLLLLFQVPFASILKGLRDHNDTSERCIGSGQHPFSCGHWPLILQPLVGAIRGSLALERCTVAHLLGLHHIPQPGLLSVLNLSPIGTGLPLLMWLAIQVCCPCMGAVCILHAYALPIRPPSLNLSLN